MRSTPPRKGTMSKEKRAEMREAREQLQATAMANARLRVEPLSLDDLERIPEEIQKAVEVVVNMQWGNFVEAIRVEVEHPNVETVVELPGSTEEGAASVQ